MPKTSLQSLIRSTVSTFQQANQPYNLALVLKNLNAPTDFVIDVDKAETLLVKDFYLNQNDYEIDFVGEDVVFAPTLMQKSEIKSILYPAPVDVVPAKRRIFYNFCKPTTNGRIRVPVRVMSRLAQAKSSVWMVKNGDVARIYSHRPRMSHPNEAEKYSTDCYGNLLFLAPNPKKDYAFSVSRGVITASPVE
jgi:hypothetical protein